jgi:hypothetical protein
MQMNPEARHPWRSPPLVDATIQAPIPAAAFLVVLLACRAVLAPELMATRVFGLR